MKFRSPLLTLSTLAVALASFGVLITAPPKAVDAPIPAHAHFGKLHDAPNPRLSTALAEASRAEAPRAPPQLSVHANVGERPDPDRGA